MSFSDYLDEYTKLFEDAQKKSSMTSGDFESALKADQNHFFWLGWIGGRNNLIESSKAILKVGEKNEKS